MKFSLFMLAQFFESQLKGNVLSCGKVKEAGV